MKTVNALKLRNHLGEILHTLEETGEPIMVSKGRKIQAVLVTPEQFEKRFLDYQTEEKKRSLLEAVKSLRDSGKTGKDSVTILRETRGYES